MDDILSAAEEILGPAVRVERHRDWAVFWCPFHNDSSRAGQGGHPNFGVHLVDGYWKCLRCGATGGSLNALRIKLGQNWKSPVSAAAPTHPPRPPSQVKMLDEAMSEARSVVQHSPAWAYLAKRGVLPYTALVYGLGYGIPNPSVHSEIFEAAKQSLMVRHDGTWLWAGGVVYADPPSQPSVMNVRYIPEEHLPKGRAQIQARKESQDLGQSHSTSWKLAHHLHDPNTGRTRRVVRLAHHCPEDSPARTRSRYGCRIHQRRQSRSQSAQLVQPTQ